MCSLIDAIFFQLPSAIPTCLTFYMFRESAEINRNLQKIARIKRHEFEEGGCARREEVAADPRRLPLRLFHTEKMK